jgi:hypothetical protein
MESVIYRSVSGRRWGIVIEMKIYKSKSRRKKKSTAMV